MGLLKRLAPCFLAGGVAGTLLDGLQTSFGVIRYRHPFLAGEAWWTPLIMGTAGVALVAAYDALRARYREPADGTNAEVASAAAWFYAVYFATAAFWAWSVALAVLFAASFVARALSAPPSRALWAHAGLACALGVLAELALTRVGAFRYLHPDALGLPYWLGGLYLHAALLGRAVDRRWPVRAG